MRAYTLTDADEALARWRERLAAASRNVVELSELPAYLALKATQGSGRTAEAARALVATMDELWQGVLLIGNAIDRAAAARQGGSRLWRGEEAAAEAMAILDGETIEIVTGDLPVLNRGLLASARATIRVTPQRLLDAMEQAFERAKASIDALAQARARCDAARAEIATMLTHLAADGWPAAAETRARLDSAMADADPLGALDRIEALRAPIVAATRLAEAAELELAGARRELAAISALRQRLEQAADAYGRAIDAPLRLPDPREGLELAPWLDRLARTKRAGQLDGFRVGLTRWRDLACKVRAECETSLSAATAALARRDELRGRYGALRAKQSARTADGAAEEAARKLQTLLFGTVTNLEEAERQMSIYEAALARAATPTRTG